MRGVSSARAHPCRGCRQLVWRVPYSGEPGGSPTGVVEVPFDVLEIKQGDLNMLDTVKCVVIRRRRIRCSKAKKLVSGASIGGDFRGAAVS